MRLGVVAELVVIGFAVASVFPQAELVFALVYVGALIPLALMVFLFNRPRVIVPPSLREQDGWLIEFLRRRRT